MSRRPYRIGISGSYGGLNLGDEAILRVIVAEIRRSFPAEITVFSRDPDHTRSNHDVDRAVPARSLSRAEVSPEIERLDVFVLGGGGILFDGETAAFLREALIAEERRVPVMVYAVSAGPLERAESQQMVRECLDAAAVVTVRERRAQRLLEEIGVRQPIEVTADPALLLEPAPLPEDTLKREGLENRPRKIGFSVREPGPAAPHIDEGHYHALLANAADYMVERLDADLVFVPMERQVRDVQHAHRVVGRMASAARASVLKERYTAAEILSLVGHLDFVVGMRLHFLIFAALQGVPFVALPYAGKVEGFVESVGLPAPPMQDVNPGQLIAHIDRSWDFRESLRRGILEAVPALQAKSRRNHEILVELVTGKSAQAAASGKRAAEPRRRAWVPSESRAKSAR